MQTRAPAIALLVSAGALGVAALTKAWFLAHDGGVGLLGVESCRHGLCQSLNWFDIEHVPAQIALFATFGLVATFVFIAFAIHGAAALLRGEPHKVKQRFLNGALGVA